MPQISEMDIDLYGQEVEVLIQDYIRSDRVCDNPETLNEQIRQNLAVICKTPQLTELFASNFALFQPGQNS